MQLNEKQRNQIIEALIAQRTKYDVSDSQFAKIYGINGAVYSRIKSGERDRVIADSKLISIGRKLNVSFGENDHWNIVETTTYKYINEQIAYCQQNAEARMLVDIADIGKTTAGKQYCIQNRNAFYIDCSQYKTKREFVRELAKIIGVDSQGKISDIIKDTVYTIGLLSNPVIVLDEAGDLEYPAWLELKAYWNALEGHCGWYMMGADGLKAKVQRHINSKKVGYTEIFSRYGSDYKQATPKTPAELAVYLRNEATIVAKSNLKDITKVKEVLDKGIGLRRLKTIVKHVNSKV